MFFILCIALSIFSIQYAADNILPNTSASIGFTFKDNKTHYYPINELNWSTTIKYMLEDAKSNYNNNPSNLMITKDCFDCLHTLISSYQKPPRNRFNKNKVDLGDAAFRKHLGNMLNTNQLCTKINKIDLLKAAAYLLVDEGIEFELAALCTDDLKNKLPLVSHSTKSKKTIVNGIDSKWERPVMQWLFHDLIADERIDGEKIEIPANFVTTAPAFTEHGIGLIENYAGYREAVFLYYDFLERGLPREIAKIPSEIHAHIATDGNNNFCICTEQNNSYICEIIPLHNVQNKKRFTVIPAPNTELTDIVYDQKNQLFVVIFEDRHNKKIYLYRVSDTQNEPIKIQTNIDLKNFYTNVKRLWRSVDHFFIRYDRDSTQSWLMYDTAEKNVALNPLYYNFYPETFDIIEFIDLINKPAKDITPLNQNVPDYNTLMSKRATSDATQNILKNYNHTFDPSAFCYLALEKTIVSKNILTIYSLLPFKLKHAMDYIFDAKNPIQNRLLTGWYLYHAALKTEQWKMVTQEIANGIDSYIKGLYPLPPQLQPKLNLKNRICSMIKRNLGTLSTSMKYMRYTYGHGVKNLVIGSGIVVGTIGAALLSMYAALWTMSKGAEFLVNYLPNSYVNSTIIKPGESISLPTSPHTTFTNHTNAPIKLNDLINGRLVAPNSRFTPPTQTNVPFR